MPHPNRDLLEQAAVKLRPLLPDVVFVGGCATELLITDPAAPAVRMTNDVDVIVEVASYADYIVWLSEKLHKLGFIEDQRESAPLCRWLHGELTLDVMTAHPQAFGFSNRWYAGSMQTSQRFSLSDSLEIRVIDAPHFIGTKFEAFHGRGQNDYVASHDLEDLIAVVDGRPSLELEIQASSSELSSYLQREFASLVTTPDFREALPGFLESGPAASLRISHLHELLKRLSSCS